MPVKEIERPSQKQDIDVLSKVFGVEDSTRMQSQHEDVSAIISEWLSPRHVKAKTRYTKKQVVAVSILSSLANTYNIKTLKRFLLEFTTAKLSEDGQSSSELEGILKARLPDEGDMELKKLSKFLE